MKSGGEKFPDERQVPVWVSIVTYFGVSMLIGGRNWRRFDYSFRSVLFFPLGLADLLGEHSAVLEPILVGVSYIGFIALFVAFLRVRRWDTYFVVCMALIVLLLLNCAGCNVLARE
jgi:hypothetical protein